MCRRSGEITISRAEGPTVMAGLRPGPGDATVRETKGTGLVLWVLRHTLKAWRFALFRYGGIDIDVVVGSA